MSSEDITFDDNGTRLKDCPICKDFSDLTISSCRSMQVSEVRCDCGYTFQSKCWEVNIGRHWNKHLNKKGGGE